MAKAFSLIGLAVAVLVLLLFGLDLAIKIPFGRINATIDICMVIAAVGLGVMGWDAYREAV